MQRHGVGPSVAERALRTILAETRQRGQATEDGEVTPGFASIAAAVLDHNDLPLAGVAVTYPTADGSGEDAAALSAELARAVLTTAATRATLGRPSRGGRGTGPPDRLHEAFTPGSRGRLHATRLH